MFLYFFQQHQWEGVGICSYLLINFWFRRLQANKAAIQAILVNRLGDLGFSLGLFFMFLTFGNLDYSTIFSTTPIINNNSITIICLLLLIGAIAKSAQMPLHVWLPNAMEGPTPVSALIHAATMVTAGIYLLLRASPILEYSSTALLFITWIGTLTAFMAATIGLLQNDLKRIIAYSTASQLGYMLLTCGLSQYSVALFHLINHAFFKALLFLSAGAIIHALNDEQRLNKMGGLVQLLPFTYSMMLIGSMSLIALPFLTGFYSKDVIIELAGSTYIFHGSIAFFFSTFTALLTAFYSSRLLFLTFFGNPNGPKKNYESIHETPFIMSIPLIILAIFSIFFGYIFRDLFIGIGTPFWGNSLFIHPNHSLMVETEFGLPTLIKLLPMFGTLFGIISAYFLYLFLSKNIFDVHFIHNKFSRTIYRFLSYKWYFDRIYNKILDKLLNFSYISFKTLDKGIIELIGPTGITKILFYISNKVTSFDTGYLPHYLLYVVISFIFLVFFILFELDSKLILLFIWIVFFIGPIHNHNSPPPSRYTFY